MRTHTIALAPLILLAYLSSCGCTDVGCVDGFSLRIQERTGTALTPGMYHIEIGLNGEAAACDVSVDSTGMDGCALLADYDLSAYFDAALQTIQFSVRSMTTMPIAQQFNVVVNRDGTNVFEGAVTPQYQSFAPNGESCGPVCLVGDATVLIQ